jgi:glycosyltransferase involved in cell wall biosynthesis
MTAIDFVMRSDHETTFGGDVLQVQRYVEHLGEDFDIRVVSSAKAMPLRPGAIVHVINVDRPWDLLEASWQAGHRPLVVSTIHHDAARVRLIAARRGPSLRRAIDTTVPDAILDLAKRIYRGRSWPRVGRVGVSAFTSARALRRQVGRVLSRADAVLVLADGERRSVEADFQCRLGRTVVLPNGIPGRGLDSGTRDIPILVPGRIEPRKNQVALASALSRSRVRATFLGAPHPRDEKYVRAFNRLVDNAQNLSWVPGVPPQDMPMWYRRAKLVMNLSMVEVLSLVDLEAYGAGCRLVTTMYGHTGEWLGDAATYVDPDDAVGAVATAESLLEGWVPGIPAPEILAAMNWPRIAQSLADVYRSIAAQRGLT